MTMLSEDERKQAIIHMRELERMLAQVREDLHESREEWAAKTRPTMMEWRKYAGEHPTTWGSGDMMEWARQTGREMRPG